MTSWKQPEPTKAYAVYCQGAWYGRGDTPKEAWGGRAPPSRPRAQKVETAAEREQRAVASYVADGLGEW